MYRVIFLYETEFIEYQITKTVRITLILTYKIGNIFSLYCTKIHYLTHCLHLLSLKIKPKTVTGGVL